MTDIPALAFPHKWETTDGTTIIAKGMTLRDYFAAKAMQGAITGLASNKEMAMLAQHAWKKAGKTDYEYITNQAYKYADAMMKAREL